VPFAHPIFAAPAVATFGAGDDLIGDNAIADRESLHFRAEFDDMTEELVSRDDWFADPFGLAVASPVARSAMPGFYIAGTNAAGFDFDDQIFGGSDRDRDWFESKIGGSILDDGGHGIFAHNGGRERLGLQLEHISIRF
jgi:hypothetical protein